MTQWRFDMMALFVLLFGPLLSGCALALPIALLAILVAQPAVALWIVIAAATANLAYKLVWDYPRQFTPPPVAANANQGE